MRAQKFSQGSDRLIKCSVAVVQQAEVSTGAEEIPRRAMSWAMQCEDILAAVRAAGESDQDLEAMLPSFDLEDPEYRAFAMTVRTLALAPLLARPFYHYARVSGGMHAAGDMVELGFANTAVFGVAYIDSRLDLTHSPLVRLFSFSRPAYRVF
jgi:hypothetical protein